MEFCFLLSVRLSWQHRGGLCSAEAGCTPAGVLTTVTGRVEGAPMPDCQDVFPKTSWGHAPSKCALVVICGPGFLAFELDWILA